jgi:nitrate/TMAO reductase-like tetraheme cytochrome c subunit
MRGDEMRNVGVLIFICLVVLFIPISGSADSKSNCLVCHNSMAGKVEYQGKVIELNVDAEKFEKSVHGFLSCTDCHMGFKESPHVPPESAVSEELKPIMEKISVKAKADPTAMVACYNCHQDIYNDVLGSVHGKNIVDKKSTDGAFCLDCHGTAHYITKSTEQSSPVYQFNVVETCGSCHGNSELAEKYHIEANVMKSYMESFHGKKHILGHKRAPTCVSCHGAHDIKSKDDPASPVVGINKINTCGGCHKGANEKFVAAITHQEAGPIPHYAEKGLIILTISVIVFTVTHVLLEAYSDIRDTFFRRKKEVEHEGSEEYTS